MQLRIREFSQGDLGLYITYRRTFEIAVRELGIDSRDTVVNLFVTKQNEPKLVSEEPMKIFGVEVPHMKTVLMSLTEGGTKPQLNPDGSIDVNLAPRPESPASYKMRTFVHELVHVKQILEGRLVGDITHGTTWEGQAFTFNEMKESERDTLPWEKEADEKADKLLKGPLTTDVKEFSRQLQSNSREQNKQYLQGAIFGALGGPLSVALSQEKQAG